MILFLYGPDGYARGYRTRELIQEFSVRHPQGSRAHFDILRDGERERFREFVRTDSLFESSKLAVLENVFESESKELAQDLKEFLSLAHCTILISEEHAPVSPFGFLKRRSTTAHTTPEDGIRTYEFPRLAGQTWLSWVRREAFLRKVELTPAAIQFLAEVYLGDTWTLVTELDKLASSPRQPIDQADLEALGTLLVPDFRTVMSGLTSPGIAPRLAALETLLAQNEPASKIFNMVAYWWPARLPAVAKYDIAIKSGKLDYEEALTDLVISK